MAANTSPIFLRQPKVSYAVTSTSAVSEIRGDNASNTLIFTADATNGSKIEKITVKPTGITGAALLLRFWVNNGSVHTTAANNALVHEIAITDVASMSTTATNGVYTWLADLALPAGYKLYAATVGAATAGLMVTAAGGDY